MTRASDIDEQAARWLVRLDAEGPGSSSVRAEFESWANSDLRHRAAYLRLAAAWTKTGRLRTLVAADAPIDADYLARRGNRRSFRYVAFGGVAASVIVASFLVWWQLRPIISVFRVDLGGFARVPLADGSVVALNTDSEIRVRFSRGTRDVTLVKGEANFDVAHDVYRPLVVHVDSALVRAVGTSFDVRRVDNESVDVTVTEGKVILDNTNPPSVLGDGQLPVSLSAGQAALSRSGHVTVQLIDAPLASRRLAWQNGAISLQGESLADAIAEFNRYSSRQLILGDPELANLRVGGEFKTTDIDSFVAALKATFGLSAASEGPNTLRLEPGPGYVGGNSVPTTRQ